MASQRNMGNTLTKLDVTKLDVIVFIFLCRRAGKRTSREEGERKKKNKRERRDATGWTVKPITGRHELH